MANKSPVQGKKRGTGVVRASRGVPCGQSWIPKTSKCSKGKAATTPAEAKQRGVAKAKALHKLKGEVKAAKGMKARNITPYEKRERRGQMTLGLTSDISKGVSKKKMSGVKFDTKKPPLKTKAELETHARSVGNLIKGKSVSFEVGGMKYEGTISGATVADIGGGKRFVVASVSDGKTTRANGRVRKLGDRLDPSIARGFYTAASGLPADSLAGGSMTAYKTPGGVAARTVTGKAITAGPVQKVNINLGRQAVDYPIASSSVDGSQKKKKPSSGLPSGDVKAFGGKNILASRVSMVVRAASKKGYTLDSSKKGYTLTKDGKAKTFDQLKQVDDFLYA